MTGEHDAASDWLATLDSEDYAACWHCAAGYFKNGVPVDEWIEKARSARDSAGTIQTRKLKQSVETTDIPAAPAGTYIIKEYVSVFSMAGEIGERLTMVLEDDGQMRVVGYYLI